MTFAEKLKYICKLEEINLKEFSELSGIPYGAIKKYSGGFTSPKVNRIHEMTEHPRLAQYRNMLLSIEESAVDDHIDQEIISLYRQLEAEGKGEQALEYLKFLAGRAGK